MEWHCMRYDFSQALLLLKGERKVARKGWNGKGMYLFIVGDATFDNPAVYCKKEYLAPFIVMKTADDKFVPWLASQTDLLAEDWMVVD